MFYRFDEEKYISFLWSIFHMERSVHKYLHSIHDILIAIKHNDKNKSENDNACVIIKDHIVPLLQRIADLEGIMLRKTFYLFEHTCPHTQIDAMLRISKEHFDERFLNTKALLSDINIQLKQLYPNYKIIGETIENIIFLETRRKQFFAILDQWKKNNDPSKVWLAYKPEIVR